MSFVAIGPTEIIRDALCGPQDHNEHAKAWRWNLYLEDAQQAAAAFLEEHRQQLAARRAAREAASQPVYEPHKVPARYMLAGDIVGSGETVVVVSQGLNAPRGKVWVTLEKNGRRRSSLWGAYTVINVRRVA